MDIVEKVKFWIGCLNPKTFKEVMVKEKGKGDLVEASKNILISSLVMVLPTGLLLLLLSLVMASRFPSYLGLPLPALAVAYVVACLVLAPVSFLLMQGAYWVLARLLGGKGGYREQAYLASLFTSGIYVISILGLVPCVGSVVSLAALILLIYLQYLLVMALHKLSSGKSAFVAVAPIVAFIVLYFAVYLLLVAYLTPVMVAGGPVPVPAQVN